MKLYSVSAVNQAIEYLLENGYDIVTIPGCLLDSYVCISPDSEHYNVVIRETYLNECSSAYTVRNCKKLSKALLKEMEG